MSKMASLNEASVEKKLKNLSMTQDSIQSLSLWAIHHKAQHDKLVEIWFKVLKKSKMPHRLVLMYLCNEIVQTCKRKHAIMYKDAFKECLKDATLLVRDASVRPNVERLYNIWKERKVYEEEYMDELKDVLNNTNTSAALDTKLIAEYKPQECMEKIVSLKRFEDDVELKRRQLVQLKMDASSLEEVKKLKDRTHGKEFCQEFEDACTKMEDFVELVAKEIKDRTSLIEMLEQSELYYDTQYGEAKIVANAYKNFGTRVNNLRKRLVEHGKTLPEPLSPVPSPTLDAPSPGNTPPHLSGGTSGTDILQTMDMEMSDDEPSAPASGLGPESSGGRRQDSTTVTGALPNTPIASITHITMGEKAEQPGLQQQYSLTDSYSPNSDDFPAPAPEGSPWRQDEEGPKGSPFNASGSISETLAQSSSFLAPNSSAWDQIPIDDDIAADSGDAAGATPTMDEPSDKDEEKAPRNPIDFLTQLISQKGVGSGVSNSFLENLTKITKTVKKQYDDKTDEVDENNPPPPPPPPPQDMDMSPPPPAPPSISTPTSTRPWNGGSSDQAWTNTSSSQSWGTPTAPPTASAASSGWSGWKEPQDEKPPPPPTPDQYDPGNAGDGYQPPSSAGVFPPPPPPPSQPSYQPPPPQPPYPPAPGFSGPPPPPPPTGVAPPTDGSLPRPPGPGVPSSPPTSIPRPDGFRGPGQPPLTSPPPQYPPPPNMGQPPQTPPAPSPDSWRGNAPPPPQPGYGQQSQPPTPTPGSFPPSFPNSGQNTSPSSSYPPPGPPGPGQAYPPGPRPPFGMDAQSPRPMMGGPPNFGNMPEGSNTFGPRPDGPNNFGPRPDGPNNFGPRPDGPTNFGPRPGGPNNFGQQDGPPNFSRSDDDNDFAQNIGIRRRSNLTTLVDTHEDTEGSGSQQEPMRDYLKPQRPLGPPPSGPNMPAGVPPPNYLGDGGGGDHQDFINTLKRKSSTPLVPPTPPKSILKGPGGIGNLRTLTGDNDDGPEGPNKSGQSPTRRHSMDDEDDFGENLTGGPEMYRDQQGPPGGNFNQRGGFRPRGQSFGGGHHQQHRPPFRGRGGGGYRPREPFFNREPSFQGDQGFNRPRGPPPGFNVRGGRGYFQRY